MSDFRRHKKEKNFTTIDNQVFMDHSLSMKAKGLLTQIYSLPDDWKYSVRGLSTLFRDGNEAVQNALNELVEHGYIIRTQKTDRLGRFAGYEYDIYETPQTEMSVKPCTGNPLTDNPLTDNSAQLNTNILNTNELNTKQDNIPLISPLEKLDLMFEEFWKAYPNRRKYNKQGCRQKYGRIENIETVHAEIMAALEIQIRSNDWTKDNGEFIPSPLVYLNQERWKHVDTRSEKQVIADEGTADFIDDMFGGND